MTIEYLRRRSDIYPAPTLDDRSDPVAWTPTSTVEEEWGRYQIVVDGVDVTFFRGGITRMGTITWNEPFGDNVLDLVFGQIRPWETPGVGDLSWLRNGADVEVYHVDPDENADHDAPLFEGRALIREIGLGARQAGGGQGHGGGSESTSFSVSVHVLGALYCADLLIKTPGFVLPPTDLGTLIADELNARSSLTGTSPLRGSLQLGPCAVVATGVNLQAKGSGSQLINGYIQDLLGQGSVSPLPTPGAAVVGIASRGDTGGYWLAATDGTVVAFGERTFYGGSMIGRVLNAEVSAIASTPTGLGYWLASIDGGVFAFGDAPYEGSGVGVVTDDVVGMAATPTGLGYWLVTTAGDVFAYGDASYEGGGPGTTDIVDITGTSTGAGYWLVDNQGDVYAYGDASYEGGGPGVTAIVGITATATDGGYWLVDDTGHVYAYGDATYHGGTPDPLNEPASSIVTVDDGYLVGAQDGGVFAFGDAQYRGSVPGNDGRWQGWTLGMKAGRIPEVKLKNTWTAHATMRVGQPGLEFTLHRDATTAPSVIYGEGTDEAGHQWRNSKYPNLRPIDPPIFPGVTLSLGVVDASVLIWTQAMHDAGWRVDPSTTFTADAQNVARAFQAANGLEITGRVGPQTWAATFLTGLAAGDETGSYAAPLARLSEVDANLYDPFGATIDDNPDFDRDVLRVERWETFGEHVSRDTAGISALAELGRDADPGVVGTIILTADPNEMSRYELRAGMNFLLQGYEGRDVFLHIAQVQAAWGQKGRPVTLTVDEHARDLITVHSIRARNRSTTDPVRRVRQNNRASRIVADVHVPWDIPAGGGIIPRFVLEGGLWSVIRIPVAESGTVGDTHIYTSSPATPFACAFFGGPIQPANLVALVPNPLTFDPSAGGWSDLLVSSGAAPDLAIAWGQQGQAAGYSPGAQDSGGSVTGLLRDAATWEFRSLVPPWLWVGLWSPVTCTVQGNIYPALTPPPELP